jgi:DnaK suppressor protein
MARIINTRNIKSSKLTKAAPAKSSTAKTKVVAPQGKAVKLTAAAKTPSKTKPVLKPAATKKAVVKTVAAKKAVPAPKKVLAEKPVAKANAPLTDKTKKVLSPREEKMQKIKLNLQKQRALLLDEAEIALNELPGQTIYPDLGDQASAETDRSFMLRLRGREQRLLKKIDEAIERIDNSTFGICDDCGNEIEIKRLEARPVTTMCIECKTLQEEEEKLREP